MFNYEMQLKAAQKASVPLKRLLESYILGQTLPAWRCNCGHISYREAEAVEVIPGGQTYENQVTMPILWTVRMKEIGASQDYRSYNVGISSFLVQENIEEIFGEAFKDIDGEAITAEHRKRNQVRPITILNLSELSEIF